MIFKTIEDFNPRFEFDNSVAGWCIFSYFLTGRRSIEDSSLDSTTLETKSSCYLFLVTFLSLFFLEAAEDFFFSSLASKISTLVSKISLTVKSTKLKSCSIILFFYEVGMEWYIISMISSAGRGSVSCPSLSGGNCFK